MPTDAPENCPPGPSCPAASEAKEPFCEFTGENHREGATDASGGPLVSIVIPTYNRAHLLPQALDACLNQTYRNLEVIVVNDGSSDGTATLLEDYASRDSRVRVINKPNEGIPDTVNRGWRESRGRYVTWTSDDNYYAPEAIKAMVDFLETYPHVAMVYTDCRHIDADGNDLGVIEAKEPESLEYHCAPAGCLLFRREVFRKVEMFRREWTRCHDFDFYHRVYKQFKVARLPKVLYYYRWHEASMSGDHVAHVLEHSRLMESYAESRSARRRAWGVGYAELARSVAREGKRWQAVYFEGRAAFCQPSRAVCFWDALWRNAYQSLPSPIRRAWRWTKRRLRAGSEGGGCKADCLKRDHVGRHTR